MSLFQRGQKPSFGTIRLAPAGGDLSFLLRGDPLSFCFEGKAGERPTDLANFLIARQRRVYGEYIDLPFDAVVRHMKLLLKKYSPQMIQRGIVYASWVSEYPFSVKFLTHCIEQVQSYVEHTAETV